MVLLNYLCVCLFIVSAVKGDSNAYDVGESNDVLRIKLAKKLTDIKASENQVTDQKQFTQLVLKSNDEPPCPNFGEVMAYAKATIADLSKAVTNFVKIFTDNLSDPNKKCHLSLNPLKFLKCFLGAFANCYKEISSFVEEAASLREDVSKLWTEYNKYKSKCNSKWSFTDTLKLLDLLKYANSQITDDEL